MNPSETHYLDREGSTLAYQVVGRGAAEFYFCANVNNHLDLLWSDPDVDAIWSRMTRKGRVVTSQRRGVGLSDRIDYVPTLEQQAADILAVMDASDLRRPVLLATGTTCGSAAMVAAQHPNRVRGLVMYDPIPEAIDAIDPEESVATIEELERARTLMDEVVDHWGSGSYMRLWDPALDSPTNTRLMAVLERSSVTPAEAKAHFKWYRETDLREVFGAVRVPTKVIVSPGGAYTETWGKQAADLIPGATLHISTHSPGMSIGQAFDVVPIAAVALALGEHEVVADERFLGTVLFTDLVQSTELLGRVGDEEYQRIRIRHERQLRMAAEQLGARVISVSGDGTLSLFDGPSQAVRAAQWVAEQAKLDGVEVRCGVHTGELQRDGSNVTGMTVHIGARVMAAAAPGQIVVSRTVRDLVVGSGLQLTSLGEHPLKGVPGEWELFAVAEGGKQQGTVDAGESIVKPVDKIALVAARKAPVVNRTALRWSHAFDRRRAR